MGQRMNPNWPIFIPTKGRYEKRYTISVLDRIGVPYKAVIEAQEYDQYARHIDKDKLLVLPHRDQGLTVTRNWIWDYAQNELKVPYFWTMDDNIREFFRLHQNMKWGCKSGTFLRVMEDFVGRYSNLYISGMQYEKFQPRRQKALPFVLNRRVYSNMLIKTDIPYRNQLFYNDDTDLCLRVLKDGHCTLLFNVFLAEKITTMKVSGGMKAYYDKTDKRLQFAQELQRAHPDVTKIVWRYNRWHHEVDYSRFQNNRLVRKPGLVIPHGVDNYGMVLNGPGYE